MRVITFFYSSSGGFNPSLGGNVDALVDIVDFLAAGFLNAASLHELDLDVLLNHGGFGFEDDNGAALLDGFVVVQEALDDSSLVTQHHSNLVLESFGGEDLN